MKKIALFLVVMITMSMLTSITFADNTPTIKDVFVSGNKKVSAQDVLACFKEVAPGKKYDADQLKRDMQRVIDSGYFLDLQARAIPYDDEVVVILEVTENPVVNKVEIEGATQVKSEELSKALSKNNTVFNPKTMDNDIKKIQTAYEKAGYYGMVDGVNFNKNGTLTVKVSEMKIERVEFKGNEKTKQWLLEMLTDPVKPGQLLNKNNLQKAYDNMMETGYFKEVKIETLLGNSNDQVVLVFNVVEDPTGEWRIGGGHNSKDGALVRFGIKEKNTGGEGKEVSVDFGHWQTKTSYKFEYLDQYFGKSYATMGFNAYKNTSQETYSGKRVNESRNGFGINFTRPLDDPRTIRLFYGLSTENVSNGIGDNEGRTNLFTIGISKDTRNDQINPSNGTYSIFKMEKALSAIGGTTNFFKFTAETRAFVPIAEKAVLACRLLAQYSPNALKQSQQFTVGGDNTVRGLSEDELRGNSAVVGNVEYRYKLNDTIQAVAFVDVGKTSTSALQIAEGFGLRIKTAMGLLRLDAAKSKDHPIQMLFSIGHAF